jgi:NADPH-dependent curcumin reductase CurA
LWDELSVDPELLPSAELLTSEITLEDIPQAAAAMLKGRTKGRVLVRL